MSSRNVIPLQKICLIRFSSLGDIVMVTALIRSLRQAYPHAQIDMIVRADFYDLIQYNPHLNRKIAFPRSAGLKGLVNLVRDLNREDYDLIYDVHLSLRTRLMRPFLKARYRPRLPKPYLRRALAMTFKWKSLIRNEKRLLERCVEPLVFLGVTYDGGGPEVFVAPEVSETALGKCSLPTTKSLRIGLIPSAQWPGKRWSPENFKAVLNSLIRETPHQFILFGGPGDTFCAQIAEGQPTDRVFNGQGTWSIAEGAAVLKTCALVIANDTGMMHVADAVGVPSVLIFGPTSREMGCLPYHPLSEIMEHDLWCRPCSKNGEAPCIRRERYCLTLTTPRLVVDATHRLLKKLA